MAIQRKIQMTQAKIDQYGQINGDKDIVHYDHDYAVKRGFRGTLAHGPHLSAFPCDLAVRKYGVAWFTKGRLHTKWIKPVCPGDELIVEISDDGSLQERVDDEVTVIGAATLRS